jgi:predicted dinucleotide-binding enzyme
MSTAIIGTGVIGSVIARQLAAGGENLRLSRADASRRERWLRASAGVRLRPSTTLRRCKAPMLSFWRCGSACSRASSTGLPSD